MLGWILGRRIARSCFLLHGMHRLLPARRNVVLVEKVITKKIWITMSGYLDHQITNNMEIVAFHAPFIGHSCNQIRLNHLRTSQIEFER